MYIIRVRFWSNDRDHFASDATPAGFSQFKDAATRFPIYGAAVRTARLLRGQLHATVTIELETLDPALQVFKSHAPRAPEPEPRNWHAYGYKEHGGGVTTFDTCGRYNFPAPAFRAARELRGRVLLGEIDMDAIVIEDVDGGDGTSWRVWSATKGGEIHG